MSTYAYKATLVVLFVWMLYQIVHNFVFLLFLILALGFLILYKSSPKETQRHTNYLWTSIAFFLASFVFTSAFWVLLVLFLLFQLSSDEKLLNTMRDPFFRKKQYWRDKEFISIQWNELEANELKLYRNKWIGDDFVGKDIFEWEDHNHQKIMGDTFFDLGNTVLPMKENVLMLRKGFGDTKLFIPKDVAISLDVSIILGKLIIEDEVFDLKNETVKWQSQNYGKALRKIKVVSSTIIGEVEVVYL
ncbi:cell wall-active antibiotics response protein LiaF [Alkalibacterium putridalgicola]|jgi:predicted membrane protein|uniref:Membrane protein n=1 Tax=Alkalibacterium putridalgicola TaxID=426703 RepID=A0A1H7Q977_9LACT|nr:cell wall-active antibiotics response protein LiaF [Alkalibacterium putridalgicola]GEK88002.1 membrane protein [Alkalibacterium putridalgicola]SEL44288.1 Predicted membrane protein [Alkalibacterium putridalgicola]